MSPLALAVMAATLLIFFLSQLLVSPEIGWSSRLEISANLTDGAADCCSAGLEHSLSSYCTTPPPPLPPTGLVGPFPHWLPLSTCLQLLSLALLLALAHSYTASSTPTDLQLSDNTLTLTNSLRRLQIGHTYQPHPQSWLRRAEELQLLPSTSFVSFRSTHELVWPARLQPDYCSLASSTASLSLSEHNSQTAFLTQLGL